MANTLSNVGEQNTVNWLTGNTTAAPVLPYKVRLMTVTGSETANGTEVTGGSYPAGGLSIAFGTAVLGGDDKYEAGNNALIRFDNMPGVTVVGVELWDSAGTPKRWFYGNLDTSRTLVAGDPVEISSGAIKIRVD